MNELALSGAPEMHGRNSAGGPGAEPAQGGAGPAPGPGKDGASAEARELVPQPGLDMGRIDQELLVMRYTVQRLKEIRDMKLARTKSVASYYMSLRQEELMRRECLKDKQYPLLWVCCGLGIGALSMVVSSLAKN